MTAPFFSMPPPSSSTACGTLEVLVMTIVTLPALADSEVLSNLSAPLGSAAIFRTLPAAPPRWSPPPLLLVVLEFVAA